MYYIFFLFLSFLGFLDALTLTIYHYNKDPLSCPIFGGCGQVLSSSYSEVLGIPLALLGTVYYLLIFLTSLVSYLKNNESIFSLVARITTVGLMASIVLVYLQIFVINALCFYCMLSALISTLLFIVGMLFLKSWRRRRNSPKEKESA